MTGNKTFTRFLNGASLITKCIVFSFVLFYIFDIILCLTNIAFTSPTNIEMNNFSAKFKNK